MAGAGRFGHGGSSRLNGGKTLEDESGRLRGMGARGKRLVFWCTVIEFDWLLYLALMRGDRVRPMGYLPTTSLRQAIQCLRKILRAVGPFRSNVSVA